MFRKIALTLLALVIVACVALFGIASTRPDTYHVERSVVTTAPPEVVHALLDDLRRFPEWSPFQKYDPNMKIDFSGPATGVGSSYHWVGNKDAGEGRMTITASTAPTSVEEKLEFIKPFPSTADVRFTIAPEGSGSKVTWAIDGKADLLSKVMGLFVSMDSMLGKDFDDGLANLKRVTEAMPATSTTSAPAP
jgi:hypothetical protein